jgi:endonuclease/exonuclease/phosphatase family metal-dependent hydrolase
VRVATYNIRNLVALDWSSLWWRRRRRLATVIAGLDADLIAMQETYLGQIRWFAAQALPQPDWAVVGRARNRGGGGEAVPLWHRTARLTLVRDRTRWFGPTPDVAGSRVPGAQFPRIATFAEYDHRDSGARITVVNLHLDSAVAAHRARSLAQLVDWLRSDVDRGPTIVLGDFNAPVAEEGFAALAELGLRSALPADAGPTSNGFGRGVASQQQIDHVFVSGEFRVERAEIRRDAGYVSDHYPVVADLSVLLSGRDPQPMPPSGPR